MGDRRDDAILAAMLAINRAAEPLADVVRNPLFPRGKDGSVAVWALNKGFDLTAEQVETLADTHSLFAFALTPAASDALH